MKDQKYMVGNWAIHHGEEKIITAGHIFGDYNTKVMPMDGKGAITPIILNEEWWKKIEHNSAYIDGIKLYLSSENDLYLLGMETDGFCDLKYKLEFLHDIQNKWYVLTGEELTIKP